MIFRFFDFWSLKWKLCFLCKILDIKFFSGFHWESQHICKNAEKITQNQHFWGVQVQADGRDLNRALEGVKAVQKNIVPFAELYRVI